MATEVRLPELGEGVTEGELIKWLVKPGDTVKPDQSVAELMTDKATVEVPTPVGGTVKELKFKEGEMIAVEKVILVLEGAAANPVSTSHSKPSTPPTSSPPQATKVAVQSTAPSTPTAQVNPPPAELRVLATPATRKLARELNVDLNEMKGSGLAGRVTREDVMAAHGEGNLTEESINSAAGVAAVRTVSGVEQEERIALRGIRKKIAENMQNAKRIVPHFTLMDEALVTELVQLRESLKTDAEKMGIKVTYLPFVMKALITTIREYPQFNASIDDAQSEIVYKKHFHIGFAADTPQGLVVPVIKFADQKSIAQLSREILDLSKRARDGKLKSEEMKGATITITNIGSVGGTYATPIINHPEVAILGMYKIQDKVVLDGKGGFKAEKSMNFTITADHRLIDGAVAANFLRAFIARIEKPGKLMLEMM